MLRTLNFRDRAANEALVKPAKPLPRTQDKVPVIAARDDVLILRDGSVVAAVGVGSVDDMLLTEADLRLKLEVYRVDLLKQLRFDVQLLIGTRPQELNTYFKKLWERAERLNGIERLLYSLEDGLTDYCTRGEFSPLSFSQCFGFSPDDLNGTPGMAHDLAVMLCSDEYLDRQRLLAFGTQAIRVTQSLLVHWQNLVQLRAHFLEREVRDRQAPVRTVYFVTAYYVRLASKATAKLKGPLSEAEIEKAKRELDRRCAQLARSMERMQLKAWRATHEDLVREIQYFYHPSQVALARREVRAERSVAMGLARARV